MSEYRICKRCVMDTAGDPDITFDQDGYCNYCTDAIHHPHPTCAIGDFSALEKVFAEIKAACKNDPYDCLVGISGGLDSSYIAYLGHKFGLRMLGVHVDDGLDTDTAKKNIAAVCEKAGVDLITVHPDPAQYRDLTMSFFKAGVPNLAIPQDNLIIAALNDAAKKYHIKYIFNGLNYSMECITQSGNSHAANDTTHIRAIQKQFSGKPIDKLRLLTAFESVFLRRMRRDIIRVTPLNLINYDFDTVLRELNDFCGYEYYGGKHHESILCRFLQCWWLPEKFGADKRKSHLSSLIVSGQLTREEALEQLRHSGYASEELKQSDFDALAAFLGITRAEFDALIAQPPHSHDEYPQDFMGTTLIPALSRVRSRLFALRDK